MFKVIGCKKSEGVFNDKPYSNYVFYFMNLNVSDEQKENQVGIMPFVKNKELIYYSVKTAEWNKEYSPFDLVNKDVELLFDAYGRIQQMNVINQVS